MIACDVEEGQQLRLLHGTVMQARKLGGEKEEEWTAKDAGKNGHKKRMCAAATFEVEFEGPQRQQQCAPDVTDFLGQQTKGGKSVVIG